MIWWSLLLMELCILLCRRSILSSPPWWACWPKRVDGVWRYILIPIVSLTSLRHIWPYLTRLTSKSIPTMAKNAPIRRLISTQDKDITPPNFGDFYWGYRRRYLINIWWNIIGLKFEYQGCAPPYQLLARLPPRHQCANPQDWGFPICNFQIKEMMTTSSALPL